jgi:hypothetical protein
MMNMASKKALHTVTLCLLMLFVYLSYTTLNVREQIMRVPKVQGIAEIVESKEVTCDSLTACNLMPGDILIRRYVTKRTYIFNLFLKPYFTHSALYLGEGKIIEASGTEKDSRDDVSIRDISTSDWMDSDIESLVVIRPKKYTKQTLQESIQKLKNIADDPTYVFGFEEGNTSCSELIYRNSPQLFNTVVPEEVIITPDYLFSMSNDDGFEIFRVK